MNDQRGLVGVALVARVWGFPALESITYPARRLSARYVVR